jgi:phosphoglycerate dehydrogenase-like enzyme
MLIIPKEHKLLILSQDYEIYRQVIQKKIEGLSILGTGDPALARQIGGECDILFGEPSLIQQVVEELPAIEWIQSSWAGVEPLLAAGLRRNYILTNARNVYGSMMSEYVFGYLLMIERRIMERWKAQLNGDWEDGPYGCLKGKTIGLLGVGTIGAHLAGTAKHFGMRVSGFTRQSEGCRDVDRYFHGGNLFDFARELDYLVCTLPGTGDTRGLVNEVVLSALPQRAWLINVGRGNTIDEQALVEALNKRTIGGAILDVFNQEPLPKGHPLWYTPNTFIPPIARRKISRKISLKSSSKTMIYTMRGNH